MEREPKSSTGKKETMPEINNIKTNLEELMSRKFLAKQAITYDDVERIISEGLPHLDKEDLDYPEKRDDRITILRHGIESLVEKFNEYRDEFKPEGQFEEHDVAESNITDRARSMLKYFVDYLSENYLEKLES